MKKINSKILAALIFPCAGSCFAFDAMPGDYAWAGDGTSVLLLYGQYQSANKFKLDGMGEVPDSRFRASLGTVRGVHFAEIGGWKTSYQFFVPMADFSEVKIGGVNQKTNSGIGDLTVGATVYPVASSEPTGTTLGLTAFITAPTGDYDSDKVNISGGTWALTPQIGLVQGLGNGFYLDVTADVGFYKTERHNGVKKSVDPASQVQVDLRYQFNPATSVSIGYSKLYGGEQYLDDKYSGTKTDSEQVRLYASHWITPTVQTQVMIGRDIDVEGGFDKNAVAVLRLAKIF